MKGLDFKDWMKIASDGKSTTLQHKKGHVMTIAHGGIPKIQQEQLKRLKMADGGQASNDSPPEPNKKAAQDFSKGASESGTYGGPSQWYSNIKQGLGMADGGEVKHLADGTPPASAPDPAPTPSDNQDTPQPAPSQSPVTVNVIAAHAPAQPGSSPLMASPLHQPPSQMAAAPQYTGNDPGQGPGQTEVPRVPIVPSSDVRQSMANRQAQGAALTQAAESSEAKQQAQAYDMYAKQEQARINEMQQRNQVMREATQRHDAYVQSHPQDRNAIFKSMNAPTKIATALGLLVGGFDAGLSGTGVNPALEYIKDQQAKDIQAQKDNMHNQETVFGNYHTLFGDDAIASNLANVSYNNMLKNGLNLAAAKNGDARAAAKAATIGAKLDIDNYNLIGKAGQRWGELHHGQGLPQNNGEPKLGKPISQTESPNGGASGSWGGDQIKTAQANAEKDRILPPNYNDQIMEQVAYLPEKEKAQLGGLGDQVTQARQAEKTIAAVRDYFSKMRKESSGISGMISHYGSKIDPQDWAKVGTVGGEGAGMAAAPATGGASLLAAVPTAIAGGLLAGGAGKILKGTASAIGGDDRINYETDSKNLLSLIRDTIPGVGDTLMKEIAESKLPNWRDTDETYNHKLEDLIDTIKRKSKTDVIERALRFANKNNLM